jgi:hypothetical protein
MTHRNPGTSGRIATTMVVAFIAAGALRATAGTCPTGPALTAGTQHCSSSAQGTVGSFGWSIWSSGSGGCITPYGNTAAFKATWANSGDFLAREGFQWDETKTYDQYGTVTADYAYTKTGTAGGYSFIGIYGWSNNPLVEYYIVDDWFGTGSAPTGGGTLQGTLTVDDGTYNIYTHTQTSQPSIHGTATFPQFFSVRQTARQCGHISVTEHFKKWAALGMTLGKMYEAKLLVEAGGGTGSIDYSVGTMSYGTTDIASEPEIAKEASTALGEGRSGMLSLIALNGKVVRSVSKDASAAAVVPTDNLPRGLYLLRFQGDGAGSETRKFLVN